MIGTRLGIWIIAEELGRGGMGRVYLAHEAADVEPGGRSAAIKVLAGELAQEDGFRQRFQREIEALQKLHHPNIVSFYESGVEDGRYYYAMEYVDGQNLEDWLHERGRIVWPKVLDVAMQTCKALKHAHDHGIIHRDLKPSNLLRAEDGMIKLSDFGIAKIFARKQLTATGAFVGTAEFLSPEQAAGQQVTARSDLYSLGVVLYTLLTGRVPFHGKSVVDLLHKHRFSQFDRPGRIIEDLPHEIDEVVCQLLEKDPAARPANGLVLLKQLEVIQRKLDRREERTMPDAALAKTQAESLPAPLGGVERPPGPATLMSQLMREELAAQARGNFLTRLLNRGWVLILLLVLCVGAIIWLWPKSHPSAENLFAEAQNLMATDDPANWDKARRDYLDPLDNIYPAHPYKKEVARYRQQIEGSRRLTAAGARSMEGRSEAQRFFLQGLQFYEKGDIAEANRIWGNLVQAFGDVPAEQPWVRLAELGRTESIKQYADEQRWQPAREALKHARDLRDSGKRKEAEDIWAGLEGLYRGNPAADEIMKELRRDRGS